MNNEYDRLTDAFANSYGGLIVSRDCVGDCQPCDSVLDLVIETEKARRCCDEAWAQAHELFMKVNDSMRRLTGGR